MSHGDYDYGLEDKILRKNIPGRYGTWEEDSDPYEKSRIAKDNADNDDEEISTVTDTGNAHGAAQSVPPSHPGSTRNAASGRTGAKGVLADHREHVAQQHEEHARAKAEKEEAYRCAAYGTARPPDEVSATKDDEDEVARALHRRRRVEEMKAAAQAPIFGELKEVSALEMLDAVDNEDPRVVVVVHIYSPHLPACSKLNGCLERLARAHPHAKFLRMLSTLAPGGPGAFDTDTLPVLVAYRGGGLAASIVRVTDHFGGTSTATSTAQGSQFGVEDVEWLLDEHGLLELPVEAAAHGRGGNGGGGNGGGEKEGGCAPESERSNGRSEFVFSSSLKNRGDFEGDYPDDQGSDDDDLGVD
mmetsp:Transcript_52727/g.105664  ORF Transcript_52727/g.105664 Transcript_52727/m.105664 type:complete len:358 (-) Transcript_52727:98-1171(-)